MRKINVLVIPSDTHGGVGFYRSTQPHLQLEAQFPEEFSVTIDVNPNWYDLDSFNKFDIIHIHKGLYQDMKAFHDALEYFHKHDIVTIMDIDDHWKLDPHHPQYVSEHQYHLSDMIKDNFKRFDYITTTTPIFEKQIKPFNSNTKVFPNAINPEDERFQIVKPVSKKLRIGFIMGSSHEYDMQLIGKISGMLSKEELDKVQFVLCGFDLRGTMKEINQQTGEVKERPLKPTENVWYRYERMITNDYKIVSPDHARFLLSFMNHVEVPYFEDEPYKRCWTKDMNHYYQHYSNVDVLLAPLEIRDFNYVKSPLKVAECVFSHTALIASNYGPYTLDLVNAFEKGGTINPSGNALLVDETKNNKNWLRFIKLLIKKPELVKQLQDNLYNDLHDKYDLRNVTNDRADFYKKIIKKNIN